MTGGQTTIYSDCRVLSSPSLWSWISDADLLSSMIYLWNISHWKQGMFVLYCTIHVKQLQCDEISSCVSVCVCARGGQLSTVNGQSSYMRRQNARSPLFTINHTTITQAASDGMASCLLYGKRTSPQWLSFNQLPVRSNWSQGSGAPKILVRVHGRAKELLRLFFVFTIIHPSDQAAGESSPMWWDGHASSRIWRTAWSFGCKILWNK